MSENGAGEGNRTLDPNLGNLNAIFVSFFFFYDITL